MKLKFITIISLFSIAALNITPIAANNTFAQRTGHFALGTAKIATAAAGVVFGSFLMVRGAAEGTEIKRGGQVIDTRYGWRDENPTLFGTGILLSMPILWAGAYNLGLSGVESLKKAFKRNN